MEETVLTISPENIASIALMGLVLLAVLRIVSIYANKGVNG